MAAIYLKFAPKGLILLPVEKRAGTQIPALVLLACGKCG
jgi:hypothetical protein